MVLWQGKEEDEEISALCAARCAIEVQSKAGSRPVEGTSHIFRIHCGLCCGQVQSEVFEAPTHAHM
jgi:hypothetical protein